VLKFGAIHFNYRACISEQNLGNLLLLGPTGSRKTRIVEAAADWTAWRAQPSTEHLVELDKRLYGLVLSHDFLP
jgi:hypothetical protein